MKIAVIDDLVNDRKELSTILRSVLKKYNISFSINGYESAEAFLAIFEKESFDLCFMDIYMPGMNGMEASRKIYELDPQCMIIFLTTSPEYLSEGYDVRAWRYLLKPIDQKIMAQIIPECVERAEFRKRRLSAHLKGRAYEIPFSKIYYIIRVNRNIEIHLKNQTIILPSTQSFTQTTEEILKDYRFIQSCKGVAVNMAHATKLEDHVFIMENGDLVPISQRRLAAITDAYIHFSFEYL